MLNAQSIQGLAKELRVSIGEKWTLTEPADLAAYAYDVSHARHLPDIVVFPGSSKDVAEVIRLARKYKAPVIARGAGTNASGGSLAAHGGLILAMQRMNRILAIDPDSRRAVVEPGVRNAAVTDAARPYGLHFAPDPSSHRISTIGGNIAENAGGPHCLKYGVTVHHVCGLEVVLWDGSIVQLGGAAEDWPGYDLTGLMVGSEGTLGIVTAATLNLTPVPPAVATMLAVFGKLDDAVESVSSIIAAGVVPAALELMDEVTVRVVQQSVDVGYPPDAKAVLVIEVDGLESDLHTQLERIGACLDAHRVQSIRHATEPADRDALWRGRRMSGGAKARWSQYLWSQDVTVPRDRLPEMIQRCYQIGEKHALRVSTIAHAGDGNCHPSFAYDPSDPAEVEAVRLANEEVVSTCVDLGGSISGEHGVGTDKLANLPLMFTPAELATLAAVRDALNPEGLLNPGKKLPLRQTWQ